MLKKELTSWKATCPYNIFATNTPEDIMEKYYCELHSFLDGDENCPDCKSGRVELPVKPESGGLSLEVMIDNLPQNRVLYKDSGLWMIINEEDFNTVDKMLFQVARYQQTTEETFTQFIKRCFDNENEYYITEG